jgi:hypothetical protein
MTYIDISIAKSHIAYIVSSSARTAQPYLATEKPPVGGMSAIVTIKAGALTRRQRVWDGPIARANCGLVRGEHNGDVSADAERVVEVDVARRRRGLAVDHDRLDVRGRADRDRAPDRVRVVVDCSHGRGDAQVWVVDRVLGRERRQDKVLRAGRN